MANHGNKIQNRCFVITFLTKKTVNFSLYCIYARRVGGLKVLILKTKFKFVAGEGPAHALRHSCWYLGHDWKSTPRQISLVFSLGICWLTFFSGVASLTVSYSMAVRPSEEQACELDRKRK